MRLTVTCSFCRRGDCGECTLPSCSCTHAGWERVAKPKPAPKEKRVRPPRPSKPVLARPSKPAPAPKPPKTVVVRSGIPKEAAACCNARRDRSGRLPVGFCSPTCDRRPKVVVV